MSAPMIDQSRSFHWAAGCALVTLVALALLLLAAGVALRLSDARYAHASSARSISSEGELIFGDVDRDGSEDIVVWSASQRGQRLVAASGLDGRVLWERDIVFPTEGVFLADRLLLVATEEPTLDVYRLDDGAPLGAIALTERVQTLCAEGPSSVRVEENRGHHELVDLGSGVATSVSPGECLAPLPWSDHYVLNRGIRGPYRRDGSSWDSSRERSFVPDEPSAPRLALTRGGRSAGPTLIARTPDDRVLWQSPIPAIPIRDASSRLREAAALGTDGTIVVAAYPVGPEHRAVAFAIADGRRLWDVSLGAPRRTDLVLVRAGRVYFGPSPVQVHDLHTGRRLFVLGSGPS